MAARERCRNHDRKNRVHSELLFKEAVELDRRFGRKQALRRRLFIGFAGWSSVVVFTEHSYDLLGQALAYRSRKK